MLYLNTALESHEVFDVFGQYHLEVVHPKLSPDQQEVPCALKMGKMEQYFVVFLK